MKTKTTKTEKFNLVVGYFCLITATIGLLTSLDLNSMYIASLILGIYNLDVVYRK